MIQNHSKTMQVCTKCVMDTTDPNIAFDANGVCNHCHKYDKTVQNWNLDKLIRENSLEKTFQTIKNNGRGKNYDCIMGLSGGVDSSYVAYLAGKYQLRPLVVHLDNGWNSEISVKNIHSIVEKLKLDLYTHVIDWNEFRELQLAFFRANVVDIELLTDHAIFAVILDLAKKENIKYMLSGANIATEAIMPSAWVHRKSDLANIFDINKKFGKLKIKTFPTASTLRFAFSKFIFGYKTIKPLDLIHYDKAAAMEILKNELGWKYYGGKHYESVFTKFYQAHILPNKFNIDKRKAHLSTLICSKQITRNEALNELSKPLYDTQELRNDREYVLKKLGMSEQEFDSYMKAKPISHYAFKSDENLYQLMFKFKEKIGYKIQ